VHNVQITRTHLAKATEFLEDFFAGADDEVTVHHGYIGRGMYGTDGCVGVVCRDPAARMAFLFFLSELLGLDFIQFLSEVGGGETDSWGMSTIAYWRVLTLDPA
jgi:hypothetical protein